MEDNFDKLAKASKECADSLGEANALYLQMKKLEGIAAMKENPKGKCLMNPAKRKAKRKKRK